VTRPEAADTILKNSGAVVRTGGDRAFYSPSTDHIQLPPDHAFRGPPEFAATALHELAHWTGHPSRLDRDSGMQARYGSAAYAMEELRAELASAFVAAELGIPTDIPQHASYIASWIKPLKEDSAKSSGPRLTRRRSPTWNSRFIRTMRLEMQAQPRPLPHSHPKRSTRAWCPG